VKRARGVGVIVALTFFAFDALLLIWGGWLLSTDDPDGGRHPVGGAMVAVSLLFAAVGVVGIGRSLRHR
jgi:hypothetical protein